MTLTKVIAMTQKDKLRLIKVWDDWLAEYRYCLQQYITSDEGGDMSTSGTPYWRKRILYPYGNKAWATRIAKHYNIKMPTKEYKE